MKNNLKTIILSLTVMALWGSLFPMVKIGYSALGISSSSVSDILMFAGCRFLICGGLVCTFCGFRKEKIQSPKLKSIINIIIMGIFSIVLHYAFTYIGLSTTDSAKTALIKQLGALVYVCFSFIFFKNEKFSLLKIAGAIIGFCGIIAINYNSSGIVFSKGDILIICASVCTVIANIISKKSAEGSSPFWITGISQLFGGTVLFIIASALGSDIPTFDGKAILVFTYICIASTISYTLWYYILKNNSLSKMFIIKFAEPLFACLFGAFLLGENILRIQYLLAFILISAGITLGNKSKE